MKRIHIGLAVADLERSVGFYSAMFGAGPSLRRDDYAKWQLEDPRVNFSITTRCSADGKVHFGIQVDDAAELAEAGARLEAAGQQVAHEPETTCCYHNSSKTWARDPEAFHWETFVTSGVAEEFGGNSVPELGAEAPAAPGTGCCGR